MSRCRTAGPDARSVRLHGIGVAVVTGVFSGCIAQDVRVGTVGNWPASIEVPASASTATARPLGSIIRVRSDLFGGGGDAGPITALRFDVTVRDPDVAQDLAYKVYVDYRRGGNEGPIVADFLPPTSSLSSTRTQRALSFSIPTAFIRERGCHRVELLVAGRFETPSGVATGREPTEPGDLGVATWWIATQASEGDVVDMAGCP